MGLVSQYKLSNDDAKIMEAILQDFSPPDHMRGVASQAYNYVYQSELSILKQKVANLEAQQKRFDDYQRLIDRIRSAGFSDEE